MGIIGQSIPVRDAAMKVTGQFKYTADLEFPGMLHAKILFSPVPHARIKKIDTSTEAPSRSHRPSNRSTTSTPCFALASRIPALV